MLRFCVLLAAFSPFILTSPGLRAEKNPSPFALQKGDRVLFLGDTLIEREQTSGWVELMLTTRFADRDITFRNLGWSGDTPAGDARFGLSLLQAGREPADEGWRQLVKQIEEAKPTVVFLGYGMASSFEGETGLTKFRANYNRLLDTIERTSPGVRLVLLSPLPHGRLGGAWPDPTAHNAQLATYARVVGEIASARQATFVSLFDALQGRTGPGLTSNGIHPTDAGYRAMAETLEQRLFGAPGPWRTSAQTETLRQAIRRKNEWFFHRSRPANMAYIFGFRKREQGKNATEVMQFDEFIVAEEKRIARLRSLQPVDVPETPRRIGNLVTKFTAQPHPQFVLGDGVEVTLWAENPMLNNPIQMNFDPQGRLWVVGSELYPQIEPGQAPTDKVVVLEDTTGRGRADKATVFADGLLIPTGIEVGDGGAYVAQSTELLHFRDTDGDGIADERRIVLSGFGTEDSHHNLHTLRWGPDGRLYLNQSVYTRTDTETPHGVVRLKAGGIFRLDTRDQRMDILFRGLINGWGHQFDAFGQSFLTDGAGSEGISWGIPGATYRTLAPARRQLESVSPGRYPKFSGIELIRSAQFPTDWQGDVITLDFRAHRVVRFKLTDQGSGYITREMPDVMRSTTDSFRPVDARLGPDGALYIADWSNPIIQHGEVDFRDPRRDKAHGRIWRVTVKGGAAPRARTDLALLPNPALLELLVTGDSYQQAQSRRVLIERGAAAVRGDLDVWMRQQTAEAARLAAAWMYQAFNDVQPELLRELLQAQDPRIRAAAVRALPAGGEIGPLERLVTDAHPRVRLEAVRALGSRRSARAAELALSVLDQPMDNYLDYALWLTLNELAEPWLAAVKSGAWHIDGREQQLEFGLKAVEPALASAVLGQLVTRQGISRDGSGPWLELIASAGGPPELGLVFDHLRTGEFTPEAARRAIRALSDAGRLRAVKPAGDLTTLAVLLRSVDTGVKTAALQLAGIWRLTSLVPQLVEFAAAPTSSSVDRSAAFAALREIRGAPVVAALKQLCGEGSLPAVRREAVVSLAGLELPAALLPLLAVLQATTDEAEAQVLWRSLLGIRGVSTRLARELETTPIPAATARAGLRPAREGNQHQALANVLMKHAGLALSNVQLSAADLQALAQEALAKGDPARGEYIYRRENLACVACHAIGGAGGKLGPDLTSIGASAPADYLVESLLYPNAKIKEGYHSVLIGTRDGQDHNGMIQRETAAEVVVRDAANREISIPAQTIVRRTSVGSLMPAGLIDALLPEERLDLIKFMAQLGKTGAFDASQGGVARSWKLYLVQSANQHLGVERVVAGDASLTDWVPALALTSGVLPARVVEEAYPNRGNNRGLFAVTRFESASGGSALFGVIGTVKGVWLNGAIVKPGARLQLTVKPGTNTLVLQLDDATPSELKLTSADVSFVAP